MSHLTDEPEPPVAPRLDDPQRPGYHFLPPANWLNDPNGLIHWKGEYHLFYQCNPHSPRHGNIHWGHAVSRDLVTWEHLPLALAPTPGSADEDGCWSGCAVDDQGVPTFIYTGFRGGAQATCLATSQDDLRTWQKWPGNPVIPGPPPDLDALGFRDHSVWKEGDLWYQTIGSGIRGVGGAALLYRSPDLRQWEYLHPLCVGDKDQSEPLWTGSMWECPDFFALGDRHVLMMSVWNDDRLHYTAYQTGRYADHRFVPQHLAKLDDGDNYFYAPQTLRDAQGRRLIWGWVQEGRSPEAQVTAGWSGCMSLPRVLSLRADGGVAMEPVPELRALRRAHHPIAPFAITPGQDHRLDGVRGDMLEIIAEFELGDAQQVGLKVRCAPQGEEETRIYYDVPTQQLIIDRAQASRDPAAEISPRAGRLVLPPGEPLRLHIFLDRSVVEVFANEGRCITSRIYPARVNSLGVAAIAQGGTAHLKSLEAWDLASIWDGPVDG